mmetsp:Transcript_77874/g.197877  ORF Transcript_77874/g.197877 Transcript_77874/m.197877 type:complete len:223 (+) Transcript_77874:1430-2098(+)
MTTVLMATKTIMLATARRGKTAVGSEMNPGRAKAKQTSVIESEESAKGATPGHASPSESGSGSRSTNGLVTSASRIANAMASTTVTKNVGPTIARPGGKARGAAAARRRCCGMSGGTPRQVENASAATASAMIADVQVATTIAEAATATAGSATTTLRVVVAAAPAGVVENGHAGRAAGTGTGNGTGKRSEEEEEEERVAGTVTVSEVGIDLFLVTKSWLPV